MRAAGAGPALCPTPCLSVCLSVCFSFASELIFSPVVTSILDSLSLSLSMCVCAQCWGVPGPSPDLLYLFFWPHGMWDLSSPTRDGTLQWKRRVLTTGPPGNSLLYLFIPLPVCHCLCLYTSVSPSPWTHLCFSPSFGLHLCVSPCLSLCVCPWQSLCLGGMGVPARVLWVQPCLCLQEQDPDLRVV